MPDTTRLNNLFQNVLVGESPTIRSLIASLEKIGKNPTLTTLIIGESGTGKELVARMLHNLSNYASQPFIDINCGAIPDTLLESELFGYVKGSFTGATSSKKGLFELANGGTVFLDEIGHTTPKFQVKLLKAVENKRFRRIGGIDEINISTRIIAATNVDLYKAVQEGKFREDLYYRLNVYQISVPPLRERGDDVLRLARHFVERTNEIHGRQCKGLLPDAEEVLKEHHWPGNVRQLKNAIERAVLIEAGDWINAAHVSSFLRRDSRGGKPAASKTPKIVWDEDNLLIELPEEGLSLEAVERTLIASAMKKANGNLSQAARLLRINRGKLRYRLEKLEV